MTAGTRLYTLLSGERVGVDAEGNRYYRSRRPPPGGRRERRWVLYAGAAEASQVPPAWHAWLHHTTDEAPGAGGGRWPWQKGHRPNRTGTGAAHRPPGHTLMGGVRARATGDYEPWRPG